jgi:hypothetical protein
MNMQKFIEDGERQGHLMALYSYNQCHECRKVFHEPGWDAVEQSWRVPRECPDCKAKWDVQRLWLSLLPMDWLEALYTHPLDEPRDLNMASIIWCATCEILLERVLVTILAGKTDDERLVDYVLKQATGAERMKHCYSALTGKTISDVCEAKGQTPFYEAWERVREARNRVAHGRILPPNEVSKYSPKKEDLEEMRRHMLAAFVVVNNEGLT